MIIELFYKALKTLGIIILIFFVILILTKALPFTLDLFNSIMNFLKNILSFVLKGFEKLKQNIIV